jgi:DNA-binding MarR family transcriptional regulator
VIERARRKPSPRKMTADDASPYIMEDQVGFLMRVAMQRHTSIFTSCIVNELTQTQLAALAKLYEVGTCSQNHLGRLIHLDANTIKGVVDRLQSRGLVTVEGDSDDRRRSVVGLSRSGRRVVEEAFPVAHQITAQTLAPLNAAEQRQIIRLLKKLM